MLDTSALKDAFDRASQHVAFGPVIVEAIGLMVLVIAGVVEFWVYQEAVWWHSDSKADRRNWTPPR